MSFNRDYATNPVVGVGGIVISNGRALLVRRGKPPHEGAWSIPGGVLELGETLDEGVRRELAEETGIGVRIIGLIEVFEKISRDDTGRVQYHFVVLDYLCAALGGEARAGSDASDVAWVAESELSQYSLTPGSLPVIQKAFQRVGEPGSH